MRSHESRFSLVMLFLLVQLRDTLGNEGSIAIACGWTYDAFRDPHTSLQWLPDYRFIGDVGKTATIQQSSDNSFPSTVRYFTDEGAHCYKLNTTAGGRYIIRGTFSYGNFDGKCRPPVFGVSINSMLQYRVDSSKDPILQVVVDPANSILEYCLIPIPNGSTPFISTLELLLAPNFRNEDRLTRYPIRSLLELRSQAHRTTVIGLVGGVLLSLMILTMTTAMCIYKIFCRGESSAIKPQSPPKYTTNKELVVELRPIEITQYTLKELEEAIGNRIAEGGFGSVYRGSLPSRQEVAIKVRSATSAQGLREFTAELTFLSQIRHENLVPLLGYCTEGQQQILVYPYMSNGSLQDRLYGEASKRKPLDWQTRLSIALGAARGLNFLHTRGPRPIIHRDVKSSNILLNDSMIAKVADFGFSKFAPQEDDSLVSLEVRGTTGYLDPEYYMTQRLTTKSDVFSFGVVLLEIICGREPLNLRRPRSEASLVEWARPLFQEANIQAIIDPAISTNFTPEAMWRVVEVALCSVESSGGHRPDMATVVRELDDALIIENNASQYMFSMDSMGSFRRSSSSIKVPTSFPATVAFDPPAFSETMESPHPR